MRLFKGHETHGWRIHCGKLHKCRKWPHTYLITLEPSVSLFDNQNWENLTLSDVNWTANAENYLLVTFYHGFHDFAKKAFSSCQNVKNRFFKTPNCRKLAHTNLGTLEPCVPRLGWKSFFGSPKSRKWSHRKLGKFESYDPRSFRNWRPLNTGKELIRQKWRFQAAKIPKMSSHSLGTLNRGFHESASIEISGRQNAHKNLGITTQQNSHFQAYKMQEMRSQETRYP